MGRGLMRSTGKHALGSVFTFVGFYVFSLPIGISCMFLTDLGVAGKLTCTCIHFATFIDFDLYVLLLRKKQSSVELIYFVY